MNSTQKIRIIQPFSTEFVADIGTERLHEFAVGPEGHRITELTFAKKIDNLEVAFNPEFTLMEGVEYWMFEGYTEPPPVAPRAPADP